MASLAIWSTPPTESGRLRYDIPGAGDVDFLHRLYSDWEVSRNLLRVVSPFHRTDAADMLVNVIADHEAGAALTMIVRRKSDGVMLE